MERPNRERRRNSGPDMVFRKFCAWDRHSYLQGSFRWELGMTAHALSGIRQNGNSPYKLASQLADSLAK